MSSLRLAKSMGLRSLAVAGIFASAVGCASREASFTIGISAHEAATVQVLGSSPFVLVRNLSPAEFEVDFGSTRFIDKSPVPLTQGSIGRTVIDGAVVRITNVTDVPGTVQVRVHRFEGATIDQKPAPLSEGAGAPGE